MTGRIKDNARATLSRAVKSGKLTRPDNCSACGQEGKIEGHHDDYTQPLKVVWLCKGCHASITDTSKQNDFIVYGRMTIVLRPHLRVFVAKKKNRNEYFNDLVEKDIQKLQTSGKKTR